MKGNLTGVIPWSACVVLLLLCGWFFFQIINQSVSLDHQSQNVKTIEMQKHLSLKMLNSLAQGASKVKIKEIISKHSTSLPFEKNKEELIADQLTFTFKDGKLIRVNGITD